MSKLGPALRSQFMKGVKDVLKTTAKETMKSAAEELLTKRPRVMSVEKVSLSPLESPSSPFPAASAPRPPPVQFPALCVCKYVPDAPDLSDGNKQYICSSCSRSGMGEYKTVIEGRKFVASAPLKGGKKTGKRRRSRLHLTKRMRRRHNRNGSSRS